jgi:hypothetical protein
VEGDQNEPGVGTAERAKRGLSEFLYSATEVAQLELRPGAAEKVDEWIDWARKLSWDATDRNTPWRPWPARKRGKPLVNGVGRAPVDGAMSQLLLDDATRRIGSMQWSRLSAGLPRDVVRTRVGDGTGCEHPQRDHGPQARRGTSRLA